MDQGDRSKTDQTLLYGQNRNSIDLVLGRILDAVDVLELRDIDGGIRATIVILGSRFEAHGQTPKAALKDALQQAEGSLRVNQSLVESTLKWIQSG